LGRHGLAVFLLVGLAGAARAQEKDPKAGEKPPAQEKLPEGRVVVLAGDAVSWQEGGRTVTFFTGQVSFQRSDIEITAARVLAWTRKGTGEEAVEELYAEGNVIVKREKQALHCERFYLDVRDEAKPRAMIVDFRGESYSEELKQSFYVRAREARMVTQGQFAATDISLTTCSYGVPHYHLSIGEGTLVGQDPRPKKGPWDLFPYRSWTADAKSLYPELSGAPVFFIPAMAISPALKQFPLRHVEGGHNSRFGYYAYTDWGVRIKKADDQGKWRPWADVILEADWREERGGAVGLDFRYKWTEYEGYIDTYFLHDLGRDPDKGFNSKFGPLLHDNRGKAHFFHRQELADDWRLELEAYYVPDRDLREEFFTKEFREEKEPETAAYLRWIDGPMGAFLYEKHRLNDWQTVNEYLPRIDYSAFQLPLTRIGPAEVLLTERFDAARVRRRFDKALDLPSEDVWRVDSATEVSLPCDLKYFQASAFALQRLTYYDRDLQGERELRSITAGGGRVSTQMHATWPEASWDLVGLRGLRHVVEFEGRYASTLHHSLDPSQVFPFEEVDRLGEFAEVELGMHHRFKTKDDAGKPFEFLSVGVEVEYYPNPRRDTTSLRVDDYLPPFNYILVNPRTDGAFPERHWSNVHYGLAFQPRKFFQAYGSGEYNPAAGNEEVRQYGLTVWPWENASLSGGQTYVRGVTNAYTGTLTASLTEKWAFSVQVQYDFKVDDFLLQRVVVSRDYHDFLIEAVVEHNSSTNERRVYATFVPKFLGSKGARRSHVLEAAVPNPQFTNPQP
jgi:hypothetical protein